MRPHTFTLAAALAYAAVPSSSKTEAGSVAWDRSFPGSDGSAAVDADGSIYFANASGGLQWIDGQTGEPATVNANLDLGLLANQAQGLLVAVDRNADTVVGVDVAGEVLWTLPLGSRVRALAVDGMGNAIVIEDDSTLSSIDSEGALNWETQAPYAVNPLLAADRSGIYLLGGDVHEHWMYGLASDGDSAWDTNDAQNDIEFAAMAVANGRIVLVGGQWFREDENDIDMVVRTHDASNGELVWVDRISGPDEDRGQAVGFDEYGNVLVAGAIGEALWLGRYGIDGTLSWSWTLEGVAPRVGSLIALPDGNLLISEGGRLLLFTP
jgi:hypothetical protein